VCIHTGEASSSICGGLVGGVRLLRDRLCTPGICVRVHVCACVCVCVNACVYACVCVCEHARVLCVCVWGGGGGCMLTELATNSRNVSAASLLPEGFVLTFENLFSISFYASTTSRVPLPGQFYSTWSRALSVSPSRSLSLSRSRSLSLSPHTHTHVWSSLDCRCTSRPWSSRPCLMCCKSIRPTGLV
jgi:hypothetical protein